MDRKYFLLTITGLLLISVEAQADSYSPYKFEVLQGLTQSADTVLTASIEAVNVGQRGDSRTETTDTQVKCLVREVHLGAKELKQKTLTVVFEAADQPIKRASKSPLLLILKKESDHYRLCFFHTYGVFRLNGDFVQIWFEGEKDFVYPLKKMISRIKSFSESKVEMTAEVADNVSLSGGYLSVKFSFRNRGETPVLILPPSYCFDSLWIRKIVVGQREIEKKSWWGVGHWEFLRELEPVLRLEANRERVYSYRIPLEHLQMDAAHQYQVNFSYRPDRLSDWAKKAQLTAKQMLRIWLGVPRKTRHLIAIKSAE